MKWELKIRLSSDNSLVEVWYGITSITSNCCKRRVTLIYSYFRSPYDRGRDPWESSASQPSVQLIITSKRTLKHTFECGLSKIFFRHFAKIQTFEIYEGTSEMARRMSPRFEECSKTCAWISTMLSIKDRDELPPWKIFIRND